MLSTWSTTRVATLLARVHRYRRFRVWCSPRPDGVPAAERAAAGADVPILDAMRLPGPRPEGIWRRGPASQCCVTPTTRQTSDRRCGLRRRVPAAIAAIELSKNPETMRLICEVASLGRADLRRVRPRHRLDSEQTGTRAGAAGRRAGARRAAGGAADADQTASAPFHRAREGEHRRAHRAAPTGQTAAPLSGRGRRNRRRGDRLVCQRDQSRSPARPGSANDGPGGRRMAVRTGADDGRGRFCRA